MNDFKNNDYDAMTVLTGVKADRKGFRTIFSSLLKYIKNEKCNLNQNQYDFFMKKLEKEDISLIAIYEVYLQTYDLTEFTESLFIMYQSMGHEEEEIKHHVDKALIQKQSTILYQYIQEFKSKRVYNKLLDSIKFGETRVIEAYEQYIKPEDGQKDTAKFLEVLTDYAISKINRKRPPPIH